MSSSFLNAEARTRLQIIWRAGAVFFGAALCPRAASAAETYFVPGVEGGAEYHSDLRLQGDSPSATDEESAEGYFADLWAIAGIRSPRAFVELKPRVRFQEYPDHKDLEESNEYLDLRTGYDTVRSSFELVGSYRNEDEIRAEIADAEFDDFDPDDPIVDEAGRVERFGGTRTRIQVRPDYTYQLSQLLGVGASALYQTVTYDFPSDFGSTSRQDYDYWIGDGFLVWTLSPRTHLRTGAYVSTYETDDGLNQTDSTGASLEIRHQWSETLTAMAAVSAQQTDIERAALTAEDSSTDAGFTIGIESRGQVSQWRINAGRTFNPTGSGTLNETDQVRLQYDRNLTERLQFTGAVRANRSRPLGVDASDNDRDFLRTDIACSWSMTRTWSVIGGYSYIQEQFEGESGDRSDNMVTISVRYQGLQPQP